MILIETNADKELFRMADKIESLLSPAALEARVLVIAAQAGQLLLQATVRACIEAIYDHPSYPSLWNVTPSDPEGTFGGNEAVRTFALLDAHEVVNEGLMQTVRIDPNAEAQRNVHSGREMVTDYAVPVHEGYEQVVYGHPTGVAHPGRFWFDVAALEAGPVVAEFVAVAFEQAVEEALGLAA